MAACPAYFLTSQTIGNVYIFPVMNRYVYFVQIRPRPVFAESLLQLKEKQLNLLSSSIATLQHFITILKLYYMTSFS